MAFRQIKLYINTETGTISSAEGTMTSKSDAPSLFINETVVFCFYLIDSFGNAVPYSSSDAFELAIDMDYNHSTQLMAYSTMYNIASDWDEINNATGKFCIRVTTNSTTFASKIGTASSVNAIFEVKRYSLGSWSVILQDYVKCRNVVKSFETDPPSIPSDYYTIPQVDSTFSNLSKFNLSEASSVSVVTNTLTKTSCCHFVNPGADTDINTISGGLPGQNLLLFSKSFSYYVRLKHGVGNISLPNNSDLLLVPNEIIILNFDGLVWRVLANVSMSLPTLSVIPPSPSAGFGSMFVHGNRLYIQFNASGTTRLKYLELDTDDINWKLV